MGNDNYLDNEPSYDQNREDLKRLSRSHLVKNNGIALATTEAMETVHNMRRELKTGQLRTLRLLQYQLFQS
jgi:hypothetical protein